MMKKRLLTIILSLVAVLCLTFALSACGKKKTECEKKGHSFSTEWLNDATNHWHKCANCDEISDKAAHVYDKEVVADEYRASEATYTEPAKYYKSCVCGKKGTETFDNGEALGAKENQVLLADGVVLGKTYDGAAYTLSAEAFTKNGDGAITLEYKGAGETEWSSAAPVNAGSYEVRVSVASTAEWKAAQATFEFTIAKKQLTISGTTVADKVYDGTTDATVMTGTLAGLIGTDELSVGVSATGTFADKNAGSDKTVTIAYSLTGALANNYLAPQDETATATINKKELDLTEVPSREYNGDNRIQKLTSEGCVEGENVVVMYFLDSADAGDRTVTSCSFVAGYENYSIKSYSATATITQKVITEFNTTLTPQTGTSVSISASVDLDNGKTETVNFKFTVTSESVWNQAGELTLVLEKPLSTQVKIEIVDNPNYKLAYNLVGTLTIAESE